MPTVGPDLHPDETGATATPGPWRPATWLAHWVCRVHATLLDVPEVERSTACAVDWVLITNLPAEGAAGAVLVRAEGGVPVV